MPLWGRLSGGRKVMKRREWEKLRQWEEQVRFEELEPVSDHGYGVGVARPYVSDELYFTGADMGRRVRSRRSYGYDDEEDDLDDVDEEDDVVGAETQLALRDKEEVLVQRALDRIRRAQSLGKRNVKLPAPEHEALQRKMQKDRAKANDAGAKKASIPAPKKSDEGRRLLGRSSNGSMAPAGKRKDSRWSLSGQADELPPSIASSHPGSRSGSQPIERSQALQYHIPPRRQISGPSETAYRPSPPRGSPRPLPDDPDWQPRSRSSSLRSQADPFQYQVLHRPPSLPSQYPSSPRRNISGPADLGYTSHLPSRPAIAPSRLSGGSRYLASEDEDSGGGGGDDDDDDDDDDENHGVRVDVRYYVRGNETEARVETLSQTRQRKGRR